MHRALVHKPGASAGGMAANFKDGIRCRTCCAETGRTSIGMCVCVHACMHACVRVCACAHRVFPLHRDYTHHTQ